MKRVCKKFPRLSPPHSPAKPSKQPKKGALARLAEPCGPSDSPFKPERSRRGRTPPSPLTERAVHLADTWRPARADLGNPSSLHRRPANRRFPHFPGKPTARRPSPLPASDDRRALSKGSSPPLRAAHPQSSSKHSRGRPPQPHCPRWAALPLPLQRQPAFPLGRPPLQHALQRGEDAFFALLSAVEIKSRRMGSSTAWGVEEARLARHL